MLQYNSTTNHALVAAPEQLADETQDQEIQSRKPAWKLLTIGMGVGLLVAFLLIFAKDMVAFLTSAREGEVGGLEVGITAPDFTATDLNGNIVQLSDYLGQPVMLTFWTPDCSDCVLEMPYLQEIANDPTINITLLSVSIGTSADTVDKFAKTLKLDFPILLDERGDIITQYEANYVPFTFFIDPNGTISKVASPDQVTSEQLKNELIEWLNKCNQGCSVNL